ncbi:hypothetical protein M3Y99_01427900 [Aphelenchoides fujianensis]|nr:hypothetical protein M3Y99_01427900 [Aphelenchoides fujianensis]
MSRAYEQDVEDDDGDVSDPTSGGSVDLNMTLTSGWDESDDEEPEGDVSLASSISLSARRMNKTLSVIDEESRSGSAAQSGSADNSMSSTMRAVFENNEFGGGDGGNGKVDLDAISSASTYSSPCSSSLKMSKVRRKLESLPSVERMDLGKIMASLNLKNRPSEEGSTGSPTVSNSSALGGQKEPPAPQPVIQVFPEAADENQRSPNTPRRKTSPRSAKEIQASMKKRNIESHQAAKTHTLIERQKNGQLRPAGMRTPHRRVLANLPRQSPKSARLPQKALVKAPVRKAVSAPSSVLADSNDNLSIDSAYSGNERTALEVGPGTVVFGFVDLGERHCAQIKISNPSGQPVYVKPVLTSETDAYELEDTCTFTIDSHSSRELKVYFTPNLKHTYSGHVDFKLVGRESSVHRVGLLGYGQRAALTFWSNISHRMEAIEFGKNGVGVCCVDRHVTGFRFVLKNSSPRTAFAYLRFVDASGNRVPEEIASIRPCRVLVLEGQPRAVDLQFPHGLSSLLAPNTRSYSGQSTSRTPRAGSGEASVRLEVVWGEERQRQRLKTHFTYGGVKYKKIQGIDFTRHEFADEGRETERKVTGSCDVGAFAAGLRWTSIKFVDDHVPVVVRPPFQVRSAPRPVGKTNGTFAPSMRAGHEHTRTPERRVDHTMHRTKSVIRQHAS